MLKSLKVSVVSAFITEEIAKLESALETIAEKADIAEVKVAAEIQLEVAKAKAIFAQYKPKAEVELAKVTDEIHSAERALEAAVKEAEKTALAIKSKVKGKVTKFVIKTKKS